MKNYFFALSLIFISLNIKAQVLSEWRTPISNKSNFGKKYYLGSINNHQYFLNESLVEEKTFIYKIDSDGKVITYPFPLQVYFDLDSLISDVLFTGFRTKNFTNQGIIVNKDNTLNHILSSSNKGIALCKTQVVDTSEFITVGISSKKNLRVENNDVFDELLIYKGTRNGIDDSLIIDVSSVVGYPIFSDFVLSQDSISVNIFDKSSVKGTHYIFKTDTKLNSNSTTLRSYTLSNNSIICGMESLDNFIVFVTIDTLLESTRVVFSKIRNNNQKIIKEINLLKKELFIFEQGANYQPNLKFKKVENKLIVANIPSLYNTDSMFNSIIIDTNGTVLNDTRLNIYKYFESKGLYINNFKDQVILDSAIILFGYCKKMPFGTSYPFKFICSPNSKFLIQLDSTDYLHSATTSFQGDGQRNNFFVFGSKGDSVSATIDYLYFEKFSYIDFTASINSKKIYNPNFYFFPNPTSGQLNFTQLPQHLWVYSTTGALLFQSQNPQPTLNLNLPNGMYFLQAQFEDGLKSQTLIIQKQ